MDHLNDRPGPGNFIGRILSSPQKVYFWLAAYFIAQVFLRAITSSTADLDESEQLLTTQQFAWGYGPQPPLYTWLLFPVIGIFGPGILGLALFKNLLLFCIYALTYRSARALSFNHWHAVAATVSLLFLPQVAWESQRDLTHSVLVTCMVAAALYLFLRLREKREWRWYLAFGFCMGLGLLAKYSFLPFAAGLLIAALSVPSLRPAVWSPRMLVSLGVAAVIVIPHLLWAGRHPDLVLAASQKFSIQTGRPWLESIVAGILQLLGAIGTHIGALLGIYLFLSWRWPLFPLPPAPGLSEPRRLLARTLGVILVCLLAAVLCFKVTGIKDRWLLPFFVSLPLLLVAVLAPRLDAARITALICLAAVVAAIVSILIPTRVWLAESFRHPQALNAPFKPLADQIHRLSPGGQLILANENWIGGNLKLRFPQRFIFTPQVPLQPNARSGDDCLLVWDATRNALPPRKFLSFASPFAGIEGTNWSYVEAPLYHYASRSMRLGVARAKFR